MVPFSMRILQAELPQYMGRPRDALDNLYELQRNCAKVVKNLRENLMEDGSHGEMTDENRMGTNSVVLLVCLLLMFLVTFCKHFTRLSITA